VRALRRLRPASARRVGSGVETGSGSIIAVALLAAILALATLALSLSLALATKQMVAAAADAAAIAAADARAGAVGGSPCDRALQVATAAGVQLVRCSSDGFVMTVRMERRILGIAVAVTSTAGPPGH